MPFESKGQQENNTHVVNGALRYCPAFLDKRASASFKPHPLSAWNPSPISSIDGNSKDQYLKWAIFLSDGKKHVSNEEKGQ